MRFVSLNAWGGQLWPELKAWVSTINADVLCLQEVICSPEPAPDWLTYEDPNRKLAQRANLFGEVSALLPDHLGIFAPAARGPLFDDAGCRFDTDHGVAMWVHRRHAITAARCDFAYGTYRSNGWGEEPIPRALQMIRLNSPDLSRSVVLGHFHGLRHPSGKGDEPERRVQTAQVMDHLTALRQFEEPAILAGDFNLLPDSHFFETMARVRMFDQISHHRVTDTRTSRYAKLQRYANYLLSSPGITIGNFDVPAHPEVSDHRPLILDFSV